MTKTITKAIKGWEKGGAPCRCLRLLNLATVMMPLEIHVHTVILEWRWLKNQSTPSCISSATYHNSMENSLHLTVQSHMHLATRDPSYCESAGTMNFVCSMAVANIWFLWMRSLNHTPQTKSRHYAQTEPRQCEPRTEND